MRDSRRAPRRVLIAWIALAAGLVFGLGLWIVHGILGGVPGPVVAGVYLDGAADIAVVAVYMLSATALATVSAVMVSRVPWNRIGWILGAVAVWMVATFDIIMALYFIHSPGDALGELANWLGTWTFVLFVPTGFVLMIFPNGSLPSWRWWILPWLAVLGTAGWAALEASGPSLGLENELPNPYANAAVESVAEVVAALMLPALIGTVGSLVVRYRRSLPEVRLQIKWVALGGVLQVAVIFFTWAVDLLSPSDFPVQAVLIGMLSTLIVPIALGMAILRFRLYEIDRLVSRTVSYALLGALLAGVFYIGVIGVQAFFGAPNDLAVAGTTLAIAALFDPLRRRLQLVMDKRFNRRKFDAEQVVESFSVRMGSVTNTDDLVSDLKATLERTLAPASIGIWMRH